MAQDDAQAELAPNGTMRAGINMANALLVTGKTAAGEPIGVAADMAAEIAKRLGVKLVLVPFASPGEVADAAERGLWDIALIGAEPERAKSIAFTAAYCEIEATYLVPKGSPFTRADEVDRPGVRIAVNERSAYDLYLTRSLRHAKLVRVPGAAAAFDLFVNEKLDALAGLRPGFAADAKKLPGARILEGRFTAVQQAVGTRRGNAAGATFLSDFVEEAKAGGLVERLIARHGVAGRLAVAPPG